jgi:capsular exopolysaccharide synthesis family protein
MNKLFGITQGTGLSDILAGFSDLSCIQKTNIENVKMLTAGTIPPNPSELLLSDEFSKLLHQLYDKFDYIFIDTPPVVLFTDAISIAPQTDGVVLIVKYAGTSEENMEHMLDKFKKVNANLLGVVMNNVNIKKYYGMLGATNEGRYYSHYGYGRR